MCNKHLGLLVMLSCLVITGCNTDRIKREAETALIQQGYTDVKITGWTPFACSESDDYNEGFEATTAAGYRVKGVVCMGLFKGSTIRTF